MTNTLSPEARNLIQRSLDWLTPKGRWTKGWGLFKDKILGEYEIEDPDELENRSWEYVEMDKEFWDKDGNYIYEVVTPFADRKEPDASCLVGSMIINNGGRRDEVFNEAVLFLYNLAKESKSPSLRNAATREDRWPGEYDDREEVNKAINGLVNVNDIDSYSHKRHVLNLFRRAIGR